MADLAQQTTSGLGNEVTEMYSIPDDALTNLFEIVLVKVPSNLRTMTNVSPTIREFRARIQKLTMPGVNLESYDKHYKTAHIEMPSGKVNRSKEFSIEIRVDRNFLFYTLFQAWADTINSSDNVMSLAAHSGCLGTVAVRRLLLDLKAADAEDNAGWTFHNVWVKSISDVEFDWSSGEPVNCEIVFSYGWIEYHNETFNKSGTIDLGRKSTTAT